MSARGARRGFAARPGDAESWIKAPDASSRRGDERLRLHRAPDDRRHAGAARPHQGRRLPARDHRRRHAARPLRARIPRRSRRVLMNDNEPSPPRVVPPSHRRTVALTHVELTWIEKKIEHWLRFGRRAEEKILDRRRSISSFKPGSIFAFVRWASNDFGTVISRMDIVRAVEPGARLQTLPFVRPGGEILLRVDSWPEGRARAAGDRRRRGTRHRSRRRRAGILAPPPQPSRRRP